ncbi:MAG: Dihydrolipoyllysine-residue acetyltransferase component of acetoin cleaving system [Candidatus Anoxychlamydiales bacterium]|nr:Dihydrolipoyllysine-residue acetyltransferase component of acetoin cleaving system [Candidatus Anoxychlamydiales bacterium]NGX36644.1 Dihydrolipoyllysine-residue acetyltransferase component of acetoin cleaving system [Candidatus Anoxychlamydiales bacterium]
MKKIDQKMKRKSKTIYIFLAVITLIFTGYTLAPPIIAKYYTQKAFKDLSLDIKNIEYDNDFFEYVEGGTGETIVFVHGFQSTKSYWLPYLKRLNKNYKTIAFDLPGHGNSSRPQKQKYDLQSLTTSLERFINEKELKDFHIIGTSMGGGLAAIYAYNNPERVKSLIMINPLGIDQEKKSELQLLMEKGKNLFFPKDLQEFDEMSIYVTGKTLPLSTYFKKFALGKMVKSYGFFKKAFIEMLTTSKPLDDILPKIKTPSLILIGQKDRIIHPASYEHFVDLMPNIRAIRLKNGAHAFIGKDFEEATKSIEEFLKNSSD